MDFIAHVFGALVSVQVITFLEGGIFPASIQAGRNRGIVVYQLSSSRKLQGTVKIIEAFSYTIAEHFTIC